MAPEKTGNCPEFSKKKENPGISIQLYYFLKRKIVKSVFPLFLQEENILKK